MPRSGCATTASTCPTSAGGRFTGRSEGRTYRRLRDPEIADGIRRGEGDVGFLGSDKIEEWELPLAVDWLGAIPDCQFVLAARFAAIAAVENRLEQVETVTVVTSYPVWLGKIALERRWRLNVREVSGGAEGFGELADMVADLRVSGDTLRDNRLHEFLCLADVELGLIHAPEATAGEPAYAA